MTKTEYNREWRKRNPKKAKAFSLKSNRKQKGKMILKRLSILDTFPACLVSEVKRHKAKGRDLGTIVVYMGKPMSMLKPIFDSI